MTPMKVLIIDDVPSLRQSLRDTLEEEAGWEVEDHGFDGLGDTLLRFRPDMLILDLVEDQGVDGQATGNTSFEEIRETWFCPVVVYSAFIERQDFHHPLVVSVTKGQDTELEVRDHLKDFISAAKMIRSVHRDFDARVREALRDSAHALRAQVSTTEGGPGEGVLHRAVRRVVVARADAGVAGEEKLLSWERFVVPPLGDHPLTADLLRRKAANWTDEEDFRLVLTPSCDLVARSDAQRSAQRILVARCERLKRLGKIELTPGAELTPAQKRTLQSILTEGIVGHHLPIPEFQGQVPLMVANLKRLELIEWNEMDLEPCDDGPVPEADRFQRVASTDSPFREMVVWAYLRVTGRPGLPEINIDDWLENISHHVATKDQP